MKNRILTPTEKAVAYSFLVLALCFSLTVGLLFLALLVWIVGFDPVNVLHLVGTYVVPADIITIAIFVAAAAFYVYKKNKT
jgi:uncharacterized RDD family membrane protein YckC